MGLKQRGGPGRGQGRKPIKEGQDTVTVTLRMTEAQRDKLALLGGAEWVRKRIDMSKASDDVLSERQRQIDAEDWTEEHDDQHTDGSLALAAACYARPLDKQRTEERGEDYDGSGGRGDCPVWRTEHYTVPKLWPKSWAPSWWKPKNRRRDLVRAAALLIAEIERLDRAASKTANVEVQRDSGSIIAGGSAGTTGSAAGDSEKG